MNIKPLGNRVVIEVLNIQETTSGGIFIPDSIQDHPQMGRVVAVGNNNGKAGIIGTDVKVEQVILFTKHAGTKMKVDNTEYLILDERDILAVKDDI